MLWIAGLGWESWLVALLGGRIALVGVVLLLVLQVGRLGRELLVVRRVARAGGPVVPARAGAAAMLCEK